MADFFTLNEIQGLTTNYRVCKYIVVTLHWLWIYTNRDIHGV